MPVTSPADIAQTQSKIFPHKGTLEILEKTIACQTKANTIINIIKSSIIFQSPK